MDQYYLRIRESIEAEKDLKAQYEKEYSDAIAGKGLCTGMPAYMCDSIAKDLMRGIVDCAATIQMYEREIEEEK